MSNEHFIKSMLCWQNFTFSDLLFFLVSTLKFLPSAANLLLFSRPLQRISLDITGHEELLSNLNDLTNQSILSSSYGHAHRENDSPRLISRIKLIFQLISSSSIKRNFWQKHATTLRSSIKFTSAWVSRNNGKIIFELMKLKGVLEWEE